MSERVLTVRGNAVTIGHMTTTLITSANTIAGFAIGIIRTGSGLLGSPDGSGEPVRPDLESHERAVRPDRRKPRIPKGPPMTNSSLRLSSRYCRLDVILEDLAAAGYGSLEIVTGPNGSTTHIAGLSPSGVRFRLYSLRDEPVEVSADLYAAVVELVDAHDFGDGSECECAVCSAWRGES